MTTIAGTKKKPKSSLISRNGEHSGLVRCCDDCGAAFHCCAIPKLTKCIEQQRDECNKEVETCRFFCDDVKITYKLCVEEDQKAKICFFYNFCVKNDTNGIISNITANVDVTPLDGNGTKCSANPYNIPAEGPTQIGAGLSVFYKLCSCVLDCDPPATSIEFVLNVVVGTSSYSFPQVVIPVKPKVCDTEFKVTDPTLNLNTFLSVGECIYPTKTVGSEICEPIHIINEAKLCSNDCKCVVSTDSTDLTVLCESPIIRCRVTKPICDGDFCICKESPEIELGEDGNFTVKYKINIDDKDPGPKPCEVELCVDVKHQTCCPPYSKEFTLKYYLAENCDGLNKVLLDKEDSFTWGGEDGCDDQLFCNTFTVDNSGYFYIELLSVSGIYDLKTGGFTEEEVRDCTITKCCPFTICTSNICVKDYFKLDCKGWTWEVIDSTLVDPSMQFPTLQDLTAWLTLPNTGDKPCIDSNNLNTFWITIKIYPGDDKCCDVVNLVELVVKQNEKCRGKSKSEVFTKLCKCVDDDC